MPNFHYNLNSRLQSKTKEDKANRAELKEVVSQTKNGLCFLTIT